MKKLIILVLMSSFIFGCGATMNEVIQSKNDGTAKSYPIDKETAWQISKSVLRWAGAGIFEEHKDDNYLLTQINVKGQFMFPIFAAAWVEPLDKQRTNVTVVIMGTARHATRARETQFHDDFKGCIDIINSGSTIPLIRPEN